MSYASICDRLHPLIGQLLSLASCFPSRWEACQSGGYQCNAVPGKHACLCCLKAIIRPALAPGQDPNAIHPKPTEQQAQHVQESVKSMPNVALMQSVTLHLTSAHTIYHVVKFTWSLLFQAAARQDYINVLAALPSIIS